MVRLAVSRRGDLVGYAKVKELYSLSKHTRKERENTKSMNKLEKFIRENRDEFDSFEPRPDLWQEIDKRLRKEEKPVRPLWFRAPVMRYAAAALVVLMAGYGVFHWGRKSALPDQLTTVAQINPELAQAEAYYTRLITEEKALLNPKEVEKLGLKDDFNEDLVTLDSIYVNLKTQLIAEPNKEPVVAAMIKNLQLRVEIIRQQIETLQRVNQYQRKEKQPASI